MIQSIYDQSPQEDKSLQEDKRLQEGFFVFRKKTANENPRFACRAVKPAENF